ncbi:MAG TPA: hypothetical protein VHO67_17160 [Polyangia bacterium]|nr:hypothetical protein [Polyangia bacterium]
MTNTFIKWIFLLAGSMAVAASCRVKTDPTRAAFERGVRAYLEQRGDLCVGRSRWPIDVPAGAEGTADAVQLPVLEQLGLVTSTLIQMRESGAATPFQARRYRLTSAGRRLYLDRGTRLPAAPDDAKAPERADLCFAALTLDRVARWEIQKDGAATTALVSYTYHADAPAVARDPRLGRVFPAVARLLAGEGRAELVEGFTLTPTGWIANDLLQRQSGGVGAQAAAP